MAEIPNTDEGARLPCGPVKWWHTISREVQSQPPHSSVYISKSRPRDEISLPVSTVHLWNVHCDNAVRLVSTVSDHPSCCVFLVCVLTVLAVWQLYGLYNQLVK